METNEVIYRLEKICLDYNGNMNYFDKEIKNIK